MTGPREQGTELSYSELLDYLADRAGQNAILEVYDLVMLETGTFWPIIETRVKLGRLEGLDRLLEEAFVADHAAARVPFASDSATKASEHHHPGLTLTTEHVRMATVDPATRNNLRIGFIGGAIIGLNFEPSPAEVDIPMTG